MPENIRNVDLNLLVTFDAPYEDRSVTRAAQRLALTQPAVSWMLKRLRLTFDDDLIVRASHGIVPTPRVVALASPVRDILNGAHALLVPDSFVPKTSVFSVRLARRDYLLTTLASTLSAALLKRAPNATVSLFPLAPGSVETQMTRNEIDLLFSIGNEAQAGLSRRHLFTEELTCISSYAAHGDGQVIALEDLCKLRHVRLNQIETPISRSIDAVLQERGLSRDIAPYIPHFATLFQSMRRTEMVAFVPEYVGRMYPGIFKTLRTNLKAASANVAVHWHLRVEGDPSHIWLQDILSAEIDSFRAAGP